ncbi:unnamed protein product [Amaranthus hypochondriacus]
MQLLKKVLRNKYMSTHIEDNLRQADRDFKDIQNQLHFDPHNPLLAHQEHMAAGKLRKIKDDFAMYTSQRAKLNWLKYGDDNTKLFHNSIKQRRSANTIHTLHINGHNTTDQGKIQQAFVQYFKGILGGNMVNRQRIDMSIINEGPSLNTHHSQLLNLNFTHDEIKNAMWSIPNTKAPGLDGYNSGFCKAAWDIVGNDIVEAIQQFFNTGVLLKVWNVTAITLIPKTTRPNEPVRRELLSQDTVSFTISSYAKILSNTTSGRNAQRVVS